MHGGQNSYYQLSAATLFATKCVILSVPQALHMLNITWQSAGPAPTVQGLAKNVSIDVVIGPGYYSRVVPT